MLLYLKKNFENAERRRSLIYHNFLIECQHPAHKICDYIYKDQIDANEYLVFANGLGLNVSVGDILVFSETEYSSFCLDFADYRIYFAKVRSIEYPYKDSPDTFEAVLQARLLVEKELTALLKSGKLELYQCYSYIDHKTKQRDYYHETKNFRQIVQQDISGMLMMQISMNAWDKSKHPKYGA